MNNESLTHSWSCSLTAAERNPLKTSFLRGASSARTPYAVKDPQVLFQLAGGSLPPGTPWWTGGAAQSAPCFCGGRAPPEGNLAGGPGGGGSKAGAEGGGGAGVIGGRRLQGAVELIPNFPQQQQSWLQQLTTFPDVVPSTTSFHLLLLLFLLLPHLPRQPLFGSVNTSCRLPGGASGSLSLRWLLANQLRQIQNCWKGFRGSGEERGGAIRSSLSVFPVT